MNADRPLALWMRFWFEPSTPTALGVSRVLFCGALFLYYLPRDFSAWADVDPAFWTPLWLFGGAYRLPGIAPQHPVLSTDAIVAMQIVWKLALAASCIGLLTPVATKLSFVLAVYLVGLPMNFGHTSHQYGALVLIMGVLALSRCGDACSVDRALQRSSVASDGRSGEYTWPIRAVWLIFTLVFFAAGIAKVRHSGLQWVTSDSLAAHLVINNYRGHTTVDPFTTWGLTLAQHPVICRALAAIVLTMELAFPLTLFSRRARTVLVPLSFVMLLAWRVVLGPSFELLALAYVFWVPWDRVLSGLTARRRRMFFQRRSPAGGQLQLE